MNDCDMTTQVRPIPWADFRAELLALYDPPLRTIATRRVMAQALGLVEALGVSSTADLTMSLVARFVASRPPEQSARTTAKLLRYVRAASNIAIAAGYLARSPFAARPLASWVRCGPPQGKRHHSRAEIRSVLDLMRADVADSAGWQQWKARRLLAATGIAAYTGLRAGELLHLHVEDLDLTARSITIRSRQGYRAKTAAAEAVVPVPTALATILAVWLARRLDAPPDFAMPDSVPWLLPACRRQSPWDGGPPGHKPVHTLQAAALRAGVEGMTFQSLRRSWATHAEFWGLSGPLIARVLRHTTERTSETWYRAADLPNLRQATDGIDF